MMDIDALLRQRPSAAKLASRLNDALKNAKPIPKRKQRHGNKPNPKHDNNFIKIGGIELF